MISMFHAHVSTELQQYTLTLNPTLHGQTNAYDLGIHPGLSHATSGTDSIRYDIGYGVFAKQNFYKSNFLLVYHGELTDVSEA